MSHSDALEVEDDDATEYLCPRFQKAQLEYNDRRLKNFLNGVLARIPITHPIDHHTTATRCPVSRHRHYIIVADVPHLHWVDILMNLRMLLFEGVVADDL